MKKIISTIIIFFFISLSFLCIVSNVSAIWWDDNYLYRKTINISNPVLNYQMKLIVGKNTGYGNINCNGHCQDDFDDLRFIYDNTTVFDYWIQNYTSGVQATVWIECSVNTSKFEMYYDYTSAIAYSSGTDTFLFFDHFDGSSINTGIWEQSGLVTPSTVTVSGSWVSMSQTGNNRYGYNSKTDISKPFTIESKIKYDTSYSYSGWVSTFWVDYNNFVSWSANGLDSVSAFTREAGTSTMDTTTYSWSNGRIYNATVKWKTGYTYYYIDGVLDETITTNVLADSSSSVGIVLNSGSATGSNYMSWDWTFARKYTTGTEPTFSSFGSEIRRNNNPVVLIYSPATDGLVLLHPPVILFNVSDYDTELMNVNVSSNYSGSWINYQWTNNTYNSSDYWYFPDNIPILNNTYYVMVNVTDGLNYDTDIVSFYLVNISSLIVVCGNTSLTVYNNTVNTTGKYETKYNSSTGNFIWLNFTGLGGGNITGYTEADLFIAGYITFILSITCFLMIRKRRKKNGL